MSETVSTPGPQLAGQVKRVSAYTTGAGASLNVSHIDPRRDAPTGRRMVKMEVEVRAGIAGIIVPGITGHRVSAGKHVIEVYEGEDALFSEVVEPDEAAVERAREMFWTLIAKDVADRMHINLQVLPLKKIVDLIAGRAKSDAGEREEPDDDLRREINHSLASTGHSVEERFTVAQGRDPRPMLSAKVISEPFAEPQQALRDKEGARQIDLVRQVMGAAATPAQAAGDTELRALIEAQSKQIADLTKTVGDLQSRNGGNQGGNQPKR